MYSFTIKHVPGKEHVGPDAASRYPVSSSATTSTQPSNSMNSLVAVGAEPTLADTECADSIHEAMVAGAAVAISSTESDGFRAITWELVKEESLTDAVSIDLAAMICRGFPESRSDVPDHLKVFWPMKLELHELEGVPFHGQKMYIPQSLRVEVLDCLHSAHQGEVSMKNSARNRFFWPGIDAAITQKRAQCKSYQRMSPSQPSEPALEPPSPNFPFEMVCTDYFELAGNHYLVYVDRYSGCLNISQMSDGKISTLASELRKYFAQWGVPCIIESDGGPPFNSEEFKKFLQQWGIKHRLSSAYYPQSNGRAEVAVKAAKRLLQDNTSRCGRLNTDQVTRALLQCRNTPGRDGAHQSPAQILFGRQLRDGLPTPYFVRPEWGKLRELRERGHARLHGKNVDRRCLEPLKVGDTVLVQNQQGSQPTRWDRTGMVVETLGNRQYSIKMHGSGRLTLRNRRFLKKMQSLHSANHQPGNYTMVSQRDRPSLRSGGPSVVTVPPVSSVAPPPALPPSPPVSTPHAADRGLCVPAEAIARAPQISLGPSPAVPPAATGPVQPVTQSPAARPACQQDLPRRSTRARIPTRRLSMTLRGQSYTDKSASISLLRL